MAAAIENSAAVVVCVSRAYKESANVSAAARSMLDLSVAANKVSLVIPCDLGLLFAFLH